MDEEKRYLEPEEAVEDEEQGMFEHFRLDVDGGQEPIRVDKYMSSHLEDTSRHRIQCAIKAGYVFVNGKLAKANVIIRPHPPRRCDPVHDAVSPPRRGYHPAGHSAGYRL